MRVQLQGLITVNQFNLYLNNFLLESQRGITAEFLVSSLEISFL